MPSTLQVMDIITRKQLNILVQLAEIDKHLAPIEKERIFQIAKERNFPIEEVKNLIRNPEPIGSLGALSDNSRFDYIITCIELVLIDKKVFTSELLFCKNVAIKLGFKQNVVDFLIENINNHSKEELRSVVFSLYS
ncbi:MAG: TerB family tellurite resistance protein [Candidatus Cyclobacteriaceae bacterium M2_1C_046]